MDAADAAKRGKVSAQAEVGGTAADGPTGNTDQTALTEQPPEQPNEQSAEQLTEQPTELAMLIAPFVTATQEASDDEFEILGEANSYGLYSFGLQDSWRGK